ncbi:MAG TPA: carbohydrate ABC transporter permease, partial [Chloroflexota bacterium]|nr:carbohydrate ABC transporter permease [Chloroflexota bacterium]
YAVLYAVLILFSVFMLVPFVFALLGSLKPEPEVFAVPIRWLPSEPQWQNYVLPFEKNVGRYFLNSLIVSGVQTVAPLLLCSMAGYSLAKFSYPGRNLAFIFILSTIMLPIQVTLVPTFLIIKELGWVNTYAGLIVPGLATTFGTFLMRQFFLSIPSEYIDAARIDGASEPRIFWTIMLPMCRPALSALAIFSFTGSWNSFLWPLVVVNQDEMRTIPLGIVFYIGEQRAPEYGQLLAVAVLATLPVLALFMVMQREFIRGAAISGLKG